MLADTNGDGLADFINEKIVVPENPTADFAARPGYNSTGLTPPRRCTGRISDRALCRYRERSGS